MCMAIDCSIRMRVPQHILQGLECDRVEPRISTTASCERGRGVVNVELCEHWFLSLPRRERARPMTQLALYPKGIGATASMVVGDYPLLWHTQGGKSECVVVMSNVFPELLRNGVLV